MKTDFSKKRLRRVGLPGILLVVCAITLFGCNDDLDGNDTDNGSSQNDTEPITLSPAALHIGATGGCAIDADCATGTYCFQQRCAYTCTTTMDCQSTEECDYRGRCVSGQGVRRFHEMPAGMTVLQKPEPIHHVQADQSTVLLSVVLDSPLPESGLAYTVSRSDAPDDGKVYRAFGDSTVALTLPAGAAGADVADDERRAVDVTIGSNLGRFKLALYPARSASGKYVGTVQMDMFGNTGLPLEFSVVTTPENASLQTASAAWLLLDVRNDNLFSPVEPFEGAPPYIAAALTFDAFTGRWVAKFNHEFRLNDASILRPNDDNQIGRIMRFEIEQNADGDVVGRMADRFEGFYDALSREGVVELVDVIYEGEFQLERVAAAISPDELVTDTLIGPAFPRLNPLPPLTECEADAYVFSSEPVTLNDVSYSCSVTNVESFKTADIDTQISCALTEATHALSADTTGKLIADFLDETIEPPLDMSFEEFMESCARHDDGICMPSQQVRCARQLTAFASRTQEFASDESPLLVKLHQETTREAFLGRQLAAFKNDADTRLEWLQASDYPAVVTRAVKDKIADLLTEWQTDVLDVHLAVLGGYIDPSGLAVLSRVTDDADANDARSQLLIEMVQSFRGTLDALTLATTRWDRLFQDAAGRKEKAAYVVTRMVDLYLTAGIIYTLGRDTDAGYTASALGAGFFSLVNRLKDLSLPFDKLIFARDAEVVVSTSLDPTSSNSTVLSDFEADAAAEIEKADVYIRSVLSDSQAQALNGQQLRGRINTQIEQLRGELVNTCGLPVGCSLNDYRTGDECTVRTSPGECGFLVDHATQDYLVATEGELSVSEAGRAILSVQDASLNVQIAAAELHAFESSADLELSTLNAFAEDVKQRNTLRQSGLLELERLFQQETMIGAQSLRELRRAMTEKIAIRKEQIDLMGQNIDLWNRIRVSGASSDFRSQMAVSAVRLGANILRDTGDLTVGLAEAAAEASTADPGGSGKAAFKAAGQLGGFAFKLGANAIDFVGDGLENSLTRVQALRGASLENLQEEASLDTAISEADIAAIESELELNTALRDSQIGTLNQIYDLSKAQREAELAYAKEMDALRVRRTRFKQMLLERSELELKLTRATLGMQQRLTAYLEVSQRAQLMAGRLDDLLSQRNNVDQLVGSPGVFFAQANRLAQAEASLQRARDKMMDMLVALEYYAVRPFIDQRVQILLAMNVYQLEAIFEEMKGIVSKCGGNINADHAIVSVRNDLLNATLAVADESTGETIAPETRFRQLLQDGLVPIDKRVRYATDLTVGDLINSDRDIWSATFDIGLDNFANLQATCNAKLVSIGVQLVGDVGVANPTVTLLYDGTSRLRSCQPGIAEYIDLIGPALTSFDEITLLRTPGRSISPLAGINEWRADSAGNTTLGGLPLASQFTVLIDPTAGENGQLDWNRLEDILLDITYSYNDVFPEGQCE